MPTLTPPAACHSSRSLAQPLHISQLTRPLPLQPFQRPNYGNKAAAGGTAAGFPVDGTKDTHGYTAPSTTTTGAAGTAGYAGNTGSTGYAQPANTQGYGSGEGAGYPNLSSREATTNQGYVEMGGKRL